MAQNVSPPILSKPEKYSRWKKEMAIWEVATSVHKKKQAPTVFLTLPEKAREALLEEEVETLNADDGMQVLYDKLDKLYLLDEDQLALKSYENFEKFVRPSSMTIGDFSVEFARMVHQLKDYKIILPDPVLAYRTLKSANIGEDNEKLIRATVPKVTPEAMMLQIRKVMGVKADELSISDGPTSVGPISHIKEEPMDVKYGDAESEVGSEMYEPDEETYYSYGNYRPKRGYNWRGNRNRARRGGFGNARSFSSNSRYNSKQNPLASNGRPSRCAICSSTMHWAKDCPHNENKEDSDEVVEAHVVLMSLKSDDNTLLGDTIGCAVLDSGCNRTVCGRVWYNCYLDTLPEEAREKLKSDKSGTKFRFGNDETLESLFRVVIPCMIGKSRVDISTDVVDSSIPLLLSKQAMKKCRTVLNFEKDSASILGESLPLSCSRSGHYYIPLKRPSKRTEESIVMFASVDLNQKTSGEKEKIALKLHRQFSHPSAEKLHSLVKAAGVDNNEFLKLIKEQNTKCDICIRYKKAEPRPIVGLPLSSRFNGAISMDLKEIKGHRILHIIDNFTRFSVACVVKNKESSEILDGLFKYWIGYFGPPSKILSDNGREFDNSQFREMAQQMNISLHSTAAQSPWSNGINERHNAILADSVLKTLEDTGC